MSTDRIKGEIVFTCDLCDETLETGAREMDDANRTRRESEWTATTVNGRWIHRCPECRA